MLELEVGPTHDRRKFILKFPKLLPESYPLYLKKIHSRKNKLYGNNKIGVLVSGGIDSAILYYLMTKVNIEQNLNYEITPYTMLRKEGSKYYALPVINYVQEKFNLPKTELNIVGNNTLPEIQQVESAIKDVFKTSVDYVYLGIICSRPEHSVSWIRCKFEPTLRRRYPLLNLEKSHVIDLYNKFNVLDLLNITHSCAIHETTACNYCNGCLERQWGFDQLGIKDPKLFGENK